MAEVFGAIASCITITHLAVESVKLARTVYHYREELERLQASVHTF